MPSPFPGMDPYLEGDMWQEFHETLASAMRAQLMPLLTPRRPQLPNATEHQQRWQNQLSNCPASSPKKSHS